MKKFLCALVALFLSTAVLADSLINLQPPRNPTTGLYSLPDLCYVTGTSNDGGFAGVCTYYGYRGARAHGLVEWSLTGQPAFVAPCRLATQLQDTGLPVCPSENLSNVTYVVVNETLVPIYLQAQIGDELAGVRQSLPHVPVLAVP